MIRFLQFKRSEQCHGHCGIGGSDRIPLRAAAATPSDATVLVHAADLACQKLGMGYGYELELAEASSLARIWETLKPRFPMALAFTEESFTKLFIHLAFEAEKLADHVFTPVMTTGCTPAE